MATSCYTPRVPSKVPAVPLIEETMMKIFWCILAASALLSGCAEDPRVAQVGAEKLCRADDVATGSNFRPRVVCGSESASMSEAERQAMIDRQRQNSATLLNRGK